jgi:hypothetical protein
MKVRITANTALLRRYLEVDEMEVVYCETNVLADMKRFAYEDIDAVMRDHAHLSIQVGRDIYKIPYSQTNREHTQLVAMLIEGCRKSLA